MVNSTSLYENNIYSISYKSIRCEPKKSQICGDALIYLLNFIESCFLEETIKAFKVRDSIWLKEYHKNGNKLKMEDIY